MSTKEQRRLSVQEAIRRREKAKRPSPPPPPEPKRKRVTPDQVFASMMPISALDDPADDPADEPQAEVVNEIDAIGEGDQ